MSEKLISAYAAFTNAEEFSEAAVGQAPGSVAYLTVMNTFAWPGHC